MADEKAEAQQKLEELKKEIHLLSVQLKELGEQKEAKYREKDKINDELNNYIKEAKDLREKKKEIDTKIRDLKGKRQTFNKESSELFQKFREVKQNAVPKEKDREKRPASQEYLKKQIEKIEFTIQTEALSFEREKKLMAQLKELKGQLSKIKAAEEKFKEVRDFREKVKEKKTEADTVHDEIQSLAKESSEIFKKLTEKSEVIAKAKQNRDALNQVLQKSKEQIADVDNGLATLLEQWGALTSLPVFEQEGQSSLQKKAEAAMEKLKTKGKLTKEDILAMQGQNMKRR